jgi:hypothetical protein
MEHRGSCSAEPPDLDWADLAQVIQAPPKDISVLGRWKVDVDGRRHATGFDGGHKDLVEDLESGVVPERSADDDARDRLPDDVENQPFESFAVQERDRARRGGEHEAGVGVRGRRSLRAGG